MPQKINREELLKQFGSLSPLSIETEGCIVPSLGVESSPQARQLLDVPRLITDIRATGCYEIYNLSRLSDEKIWTSGINNIMNLYNLQGEVIKYVQTKSGNTPKDIGVEIWCTRITMIAL